ncbi:DUF5324 family protein [Streptomyces sp. B1866]|uniref:DUF5324 family protein n=1 Tax=Streptomyces sp. B1866 TaxID=3075431 RepID=UPI00288EA40C|nr:DUF5324 family protein [Streptomyces sp. B1866]MDT3395208.1 DUF5324 family protein [Streptomyces sp. B1866]
MTRMDSVRAATGNARTGVQHAAEAVAPYAGTAKDTAVRYAHEARERLAPKVTHAAHQAKAAAGDQYRVHLSPRIEQARGALPPKVDAAATRAATRTRQAARQAADYTAATAPRVGQAVAGARAAAEPVAEQAVARGGAALAALRGQVTAAEIEKLARKRRRRARTGRVVKRTAFLGVVGAGVYAAWKWWDRQASPDWLVEPPAATEADASEQSAQSARSAGPEQADEAATQDDTAHLDPEVRKKEAEADGGDT